MQWQLAEPSQILACIASHQRSCLLFGPSITAHANHRPNLPRGRNDVGESQPALSQVCLKSVSRGVVHTNTQYAETAKTLFSTLQSELYRFCDIAVWPHAWLAPLHTSSCQGRPVCRVRNVSQGPLGQKLRTAEPGACGACHPQSSSPGPMKFRLWDDMTERLNTRSPSPPPALAAGVRFCSITVFTSFNCSWSGCTGWSHDSVAAVTPSPPRPRLRRRPPAPGACA